jgi:hypothetical protein
MEYSCKNYHITFCCKCECEQYEECIKEKTECPDCGSTLIDYQE